VPEFRGYITSTPKSAEKAKKCQKWPKNERSSCMPPPNFAERPYLAVSKSLRTGPIFAYFCLFLHPLIPAYQTPIPQPQCTAHSKFKSQSNVSICRRNK